jgi:uncharacterized protein (DUF488 family)
VATVYTIGHSTREWEDFVSVLKTHQIGTLLDIRAFPMSRRMPHFNREHMEAELAKAGIEYVWQKDLGGRRGKSRDDSPNTGLRNDAFRNYADHMLTVEFQTAAAGVIKAAAYKPTAIMCAERVFFHCHRMLVSDYLTLHGHTVLHIEDAKPPRSHKVTAEAKLIGGEVQYPGLF